MKIAVTSQNFRTITGHAGKARRFLLYAKNAQGEWQEYERLDLPKNMSMHEFSGSKHPIDAVDVLITAGCGSGFVHKMQAKGIRLVSTEETDPYTAVSHYAASLP